MSHMPGSDKDRGAEEADAENELVTEGASSGDEGASSGSRRRMEVSSEGRSDKDRAAEEADHYQS